MFVLRLLGWLFLLIALIAIVSDVTTAQIGDQPFRSTTLLEHLQQLLPVLARNMQRAVETGVHRLAWDPLALAVLQRPTWLLAGFIGCGCIWLGRRRRRVNVFAN